MTPTVIYMVQNDSAPTRVFSFVREDATIPDLTNASTLMCYEVSGLGTTNPFDVISVGKSGTSATVSSSGNITTTVAKEFLVGATIVTRATAPTFSADSGYTGSTNQSQSYTGITSYSEYQIVSSTGTYNSAFTHSGGTILDQVTGIVGFKGASTTNHNNLMLMGVG